ncbi:Facilitated trehalose transporter Tret1 [Gryllus bimaculatus]|nr:Facilitated trehalose transporter Tret1 [Gryllus bimaculatus]
MALSLALAGLYFHAPRAALAWLPLVALVAHMLAFNLGLGSLPLVVVTELFRPELVAAALTLNGPLAGLASFAVSRYFPAAVDAWGADVCFWFFAASCVLGLLLILLLLPETKDRPLEEVLAQLEGAPGKHFAAAGAATPLTHSRESPRTSGVDKFQIK